MRINWKPYRAANSNIGAAAPAGASYINIGAFVGIVATSIINTGISIYRGVSYKIGLSKNDGVTLVPGAVDRDES